MPVGEKVAVSGSRRDMNITFLCPCRRLSPPEDSLEEMNYHDGEDSPDEGSDQRDMGRWDLEVLIPGEWNKGDENADANDEQEIKQVIGHRVPGERDGDRKEVRERPPFANINSQGKESRGYIQIQGKKVREKHPNLLGLLALCKRGSATESGYYSRKSRMDIMYVKEVYLEEKAFARARMAGSLLLHVKEQALRTGKAESCCFA